MEISYSKTDADSETTCRIHPLGWAKRNRVAYVACTFWNYADLRWLAVHRIDSARALEDSVASRAEPSAIDAFLDSPPLAPQHETLMGLELELSESLYSAIQAQPPEGEDIQIAPPQDGWFRLQGRVPDSLGLRSWLLGLQDAVRIVQPVSLKQELHRLLFDPLTGLVNRHELELALPRHLAATHRNRAQLSVIAIDLDHFRDVNNCFGHAFGDAALHHFASILKAQCRAMDLAVRQGGEEFLVLLPNTTTDSAVQIAERIRLALESKPLPLTADATTRLRETSNADCRHQLTDDTLRLTASLGVATERGADQDIPLETLAEELLKRADRALYRAKESGRNCVCR